MRQALGPRGIRKYARLTGLAVVSGLVRGGTDHRVDLLLADGSRRSYWPDGTLLTDEELARNDKPEQRVVPGEMPSPERIRALLVAGGLPDTAGLTVTAYKGNTCISFTTPCCGEVIEAWMDINAWESEVQIHADGILALYSTTPCRHGAEA